MGDCEDFALRAEAERNAAMNAKDMATFRVHMNLALQFDRSARGLGAQAFDHATAEMPMGAEPHRA